MTKRTNILIAGALAFGVAIALFGYNSLTVSAQDRTGSLNGGFGWYSNAFEGSTAKLATGAGTFVFDGKGKVSGSYTGNYMGQFTAQTLTGTYSVRPNGMGKMKFTQSNGSSLTFDIVVAGGGNEIYLVNNDAKYFQIVVAKKQ